MFFVALATASYVHNVPLFVWSGEENYIETRNQQVRGYFTTECIGDLIQGFWKTGPGHFPVKVDQQLELLVVLATSEVSSEEFFLHHCCASPLDEIMASNPSFYVPYVTAKDSISHDVWKAIHKAEESGASTYYLGSESFLERVAKHAHVTTIQDVSDITPALSNGKLDILLVYLDEESTSDNMMLLGQTLAKLRTTFMTSQFSRYVAMLTSVESSLKDILPSEQELGVPEEVKRAVLANVITAANGTYPPKIYNGRNTFNVYFNGVFWELFFVHLVFWGVVAMGLKQLLQVQAPDRIPNPNPHKKKK